MSNSEMMQKQSTQLNVWRHIRCEDLCLGLLIKCQIMIDSGSYGMLTVIGIHNNESESWKHIKVARPMAYGNLAFTTNQPMLTAEVFDISIIDSLFKSGWYEVFVRRDGCAKLAT